MSDITLFRNTTAFRKKCVFILFSFLGELLTVRSDRRERRGVKAKEVEVRFGCGRAVYCVVCMFFVLEHR